MISIKANSFKKKSFTLIEVVVVMFIIALVMGSASLSLNIAYNNREESNFIRDFNYIFNGVRTNALFSLANYRLLINNNQLKFMRLQEGKWVKPAGILSELEFPEGSDVVLYTGDGQQGIDDEFDPNLMLLINNAGFVTAFEMHILMAGETHIISVDSGGKIEHETR